MKPTSLHLCSLLVTIGATALSACAAKVTSTPESTKPRAQDDGGTPEKTKPISPTTLVGEPGCPTVTVPDDGPSCATSGAVCEYACEGNPFWSAYVCDGARWRWQASRSCQIPEPSKKGVPPDEPPVAFDAGPPVASFSPPAACSAPEQGLVEAPDGGALRDLLVGSWSLCQRPSVFGTSDEVGLEITADGAFYKLYLTAAGTVERGAGIGKQGHWDATYAQLNLDVEGSGSIITQPVFATIPRKMRLNNNGVFTSDYVIVP